MKDVLVLLLIAFFAFASSVKLLGWQKIIFETQLAFFHKYGLNRAAMFVVGLIELAGVILLISSLFVIENPLVLWSGAALLGATSVGALFFHFRFDRWQDGIPAMVTLALSVAVSVL
ncbi:DoxX family protein [Photobacterium sanguinicancri]|uniref:DoxX family protein n=1 Tax=Photobacterium sanguinicancri TaxID=875932 RepID=A0AAW7Y9A4_9GAMM|nr:DoxX family protein [Photobacterium sanguinicancri]KXI22657.1 hypothetical protein AS132_13940 [Photobacterium sanguinicancri]MDO6543453.1 DoxX family protein [Photobacterium sanguinicancri]